MKQVHTRGEIKRDNELAAKVQDFKQEIAAITMDGKTGETQAAVGKENQSSDKTALQNLARSIAAEKQNAGEKQQEHSKSKGQERGDD